MTSFRNNGTRFNQLRLSDEDVLGILEHSQARADAAQAEVAHMLGIATGRGLVEIETLPTTGEQPPLEVA